MRVLPEPQNPAQTVSANQPLSLFVQGTYESKITRPKENLDQQPRYFFDTEAVSSEHGEGCQEAQVENDDDGQKLAEGRSLPRQVSIIETAL